MNALRELYQQTILDHCRQPHNFGSMEGFNRSAEGYNPLCGDRIRLYLRIDEGVISKASFEGSGCAISTASASMMTDALSGISEKAALQLLACVLAMLTGSDEATELGKLKVLAGVREFPQRVKCATLAWHTMEAALKNSQAPVSTE